ncbi:UNVERIFIED_ORG: hypothetical protein [Escherichia phage CMSTMSU]
MSGSLSIANSATIRSDDTSLVLYFRNAAGTTERAAIYHSSSTNTLRLRSNGGSEVTINSSGVLYAPSVTGASLSISGNTATVASKNIVRSINGNNADANGNVTLTLGAVQDVRLSKRTTTRNVPDSSWNYVPEGATLDGLFISVNGSSGTHVEGLSWRYTQKLVNGVWTNVVVES